MIPTDPTTPPPGLRPEDFDELDAILDDLRTRDDETPQWEFCEGFLAALVCGRRAVAVDEYLPLLLGGGDAADDPAPFADTAQRTRFMALWQRRQDEVAVALDAEDVESLDDPRAYAPEVLDVRGSVAALPETERAELADEDLPAFGQVWALGFMAAVETWPDDWAPPRDREAAEWLDASLEAIVAMTEDDADPPALSMFSEDGPPSVSEARLEAYGAAIWAVYDLRELWRTIGPRVAPVRRDAGPGRNDACPCGSGKKFKKCCGA